MMATRISGLIFLAVALLALGDRLGYYDLSATVLLSVVLIGVGAIIIARTAGEDGNPKA